jgi:hypothetical protein
MACAPCAARRAALAARQAAASPPPAPGPLVDADDAPLGRLADGTDADATHPVPLGRQAAQHGTLSAWQWTSPLTLSQALSADPIYSTILRGGHRGDLFFAVVTDGAVGALSQHARKVDQ